nr:MAG TPA: hypothetical protein [Caudoviricetes sp.]
MSRPLLNILLLSSLVERSKHIYLIYLNAER